MYNLATLISLIELAVSSKERSGTTTKEYAKLHEIMTEAFQTLAPPPEGDGWLARDEIHAGMYTGKLEAVKMYKNRTGKALMESKKTVEKYFEDHHLSFKGYA